MNFQTINKYKENIYQRMHEIFQIPEDKVLILVNGNALFAFEVAVHSYVHDQYRISHKKRPTAAILNEIVKSHGKFGIKSIRSEYLIQYEEFLSALSPWSIKDEKRIKLIYSDVAFPYYNFENGMIWVTSFGFLGSPGMSLFVLDPVFKVIKIGRYLLHKISNLHSLFDLDGLLQNIDNPVNKVNEKELINIYKSLESFDLDEYRDTIDYRRDFLADYFDSSDIIGEGPVFTVKKGAIPKELIDKWDILETEYGCHFYLYEWNTLMYAEFCEDLEKSGEK